MQTVYLDPSVIAYLYMEPSPRIISSIRQALTFKWFELLEAELTIVATGQVPVELEAEGIQKPEDCADVFDDVTMLEITDDVSRVVTDVIPAAFRDLQVAVDDFRPHPIHIAASAVHEIDYLLTWDCIGSHVLPVIDRVLRESGLKPPIFKTPAEMLEDRGLDGP